MNVTVTPKIGLFSPVEDCATSAQAGCLQEQFSGPVPERRERSMAEILKERLAEADPSRPAPVFVP